MMTTKAGEQPIDEQTRNNVFKQLKNINQNNMCIDCEKKNPTWASITLGIHLCYDCAGKHRSYGVAISFVKSTSSLDVWNHKQIIHMQKGGNSRALEYFRKRGLITANNRNIDYKSLIVRQYKELLAEEVEAELNGAKKEKKVEPEKKQIDDFFGELETQNQPQEKKIEIPKAEVVAEPAEKPKKKKDKKKIGAKQINIEDFQSLAFDDGVPTEQKDKIVKEYEKKIDQPDTNQPTSQTQQSTPVVKIQQPKELSEQQAKKRLEGLKQQTNLKNISSDSFKDTSIDNVTLKQNLNKFSGSTSISSDAFFNKEEERSNPPLLNPAALENIKDMVSNVGQNLFGKLSGMWKK